MCPKGLEATNPCGELEPWNQLKNIVVYTVEVFGYSEVYVFSAGHRERHDKEEQLLKHDSCSRDSSFLGGQEPITCGGTFPEGLVLFGSMRLVFTLPCLQINFEVHLIALIFFGILHG